MIKKVTMYVDVPEEELLEDEYYRKEYKESLKDSTPEEALSMIVENYLNLVVQNCFCDEPYLIAKRFTVDDVTDDDKESFDYRKLVKDEFIQYPWWVNLIPIRWLRDKAKDWCWICGR